MNGFVLTQCVVQRKASRKELEAFVGHTFSAHAGRLDANEVTTSLDFLLRNHLIEPVDGMDGFYQPRPLGQTISLCGISPESGSLMAGMLRALIKLQKKQAEETGRSEALIDRLTSLDFLFLTASAHECRDHWLKKSDTFALDAVQAYIESLPMEEKPLFNRWRDPVDPTNPTRRLLSSLRIEANLSDPEECSQLFNRIMATAILLHRHAKGESMASLSQVYSNSRRNVQEGDLESGLKFRTLWVLSCLSQLCDPEKAYNMKQIKFRILELIQDINMGSEMGKLVAIPGIGSRTIQKLIAGGYLTLDSLRENFQSTELAGFLANDQLRKVRRWIQSRSR